VLISSEILQQHPAVSVRSASGKGETALENSREYQEMRWTKREAERVGKKKRKEEGRRSDKRIKEKFGKFDRN